MAEIDYRNCNWDEIDENCIVFDGGNPYQSKLFTECVNCNNFNGWDVNAPICTYYIVGIPPDIWLEDIECEKAERRKNMAVLNPCRCCGSLTIEEYGNFEICDICNWEDDDIQFDNPDFSGGANELSLNEAKKQYKSK